MYEQSEQIGELIKALVEASKEIQGPKKDSTNPHFKNEYASLEACIHATKPGLSKHGLSVIQLPGTSSDKVPSIRTTLAHTSGQYIASEYPLCPDKQTPQGYGSAISYARRYALLGLLNLAAEDDDGNGASVSHQMPTTTPLNTVRTQNKGIPAATRGTVSEAQLKRLYAISKKAGWTNDDCKAYLDKLGLTEATQLNYMQYEHMCKVIEGLPKVVTGA